MEVLTGIITDAEVVTSTEVVIDSKLPDTEVEVSKSITAEVSPDNYVLSSGGMYGAGFTGDAPTWLLDAVQQELSTGTGNVMSVLQGIQTVLDSLILGVNQNIAQIESTILSQSSLATSVQSQIDANEASILDVATTRVTPTEASTIALQVQQSTFGTDATAFIGNIASTYVSPTSAIAQDVSLITTELNDISASISEVSLLTTEVVLNPAWVDDGSNTDPDSSGNPKYITRAIAKKQLQVDANGVITGYIAESGTTSNFTINADNFSVRATGQSVASQNPFTINATTGDITLNGKVSFNSVTGALTSAQQLAIDSNAITNGAGWTNDATANTALSKLTDIASDNILSPVEKSAVILEDSVITAERADILAQATTFGVTTERTTYDTAVSALTTYLATLTAPVLWSNTAGDTTIVGTTFRSKFSDVYTARQTLLNKIYSEAKRIADSKVLPADVAAAINANTTTIDGGKITTGTITTDQLAMNTGWAGVIYNLGGTADGYSMKIDFTNGRIHIK